MKMSWKSKLWDSGSFTGLNVKWRLIKMWKMIKMILLRVWGTQRSTWPNPGNNPLTWKPLSHFVALFVWAHLHARTAMQLPPIKCYCLLLMRAACMRVWANKLRPPDPGWRLRATLSPLGHKASFSNQPWHPCAFSLSGDTIGALIASDWTSFSPQSLSQMPFNLPTPHPHLTPNWSDCFPSVRLWSQKCQSQKFWPLIWSETMERDQQW